MKNLRFVPCVLIILLALPLTAQEKPSLGSIAVLRLKNISETPENRALLNDFVPRLNHSLTAFPSLRVPSWEEIAEAIDDEGVRVDDLIDLDDYVDAAKALKVDYFVIGSLFQKMQTLYAYTRIYTVADGSLKAVVNSESALDHIPQFLDLLSHRLEDALQNPVRVDSAFDSFEWKEQFRFAFGPDRLDLAPPLVHFVNANPPFEISVKVNMDRMAGGFVVTNFDIYADNEPIATIGPDLSPPIELREYEVEIGGHTFCFRANLKELRGIRNRAISTALIDLTARSCD